MRIAGLFSGAGGSAMGLHQAFPDAEIVGFDIRPQPRFPFTFVQQEDAYHTYGRIPLEYRRLEAKQDAMGIDWMTGVELNEAIPPAYSAYLAQFIPLPVALEAAA